MISVLIAESDDFSASALRRLESHARVLAADLQRETLLRAVADAEVLWVRLRNRIDAEVFDAGPRLRAIVSPTTGLNHIDLTEAARRQIKIISLKGETEFLNRVRATAEHTLALTLSLLRKIPAANADVRRGNWNREPFRGQELYEKTAGIIGYGRLGRIVAKYLHALGMTVLTATREDELEPIDPHVRLVTLPELLASSDLISIHVNWTPENERFLGRDQFACIKHGAWFVNTSRGELLDERVLLDCLISGQIAGAALDVLADELTVDFSRHPLIEYARNHDNLILTPHIGGNTWESRHKTEEFLVDRLLTWISASRPVAGV